MIFVLREMPQNTRVFTILPFGMQVQAQYQSINFTLYCNTSATTRKSLQPFRLHFLPLAHSYEIYIFLTQKKTRTNCITIKFPLTSEVVVSPSPLQSATSSLLEFIFECMYCI